MIKHPNEQKAPEINIGVIIDRNIDKKSEKFTIVWYNDGNRWRKNHG